MFKRLFVTAIAATLVFGAANAFATASRMESLGNQGLYLVDDTNVFANPAVLSYYRNVLFLHMGGIKGGDVSAIGAISLKLGDDFTLAVLAGGPGALVAITESSIGQIRTDAIMAGAFADHFGFFAGPNPPNDADAMYMNPLGIILAYKIGDVSIGAEYRFMSGVYNYSDDIAETEIEQKARLDDIHLGFSVKSGKFQPEGWIHFAPYSIKSDVTDDIADTSSSQELRGQKYALGARLLYTFSDTLTLVPAVQYERAAGNVKTDADPDITIVFGGDTFSEEELIQDYSVQTLTAGLNGQYATGGFFGLLVTASAGVQWSRWERELSIASTEFSQEDVNKNFAAPTASLGIELWPNETFAFRAGVATTTVWAAMTESNSVVDTNGNTTVNLEETSTIQNTTAAVGLGLHFGNLLIDATFGNKFLSNEDGEAMGNLFSNLDVKARW